MEKQSDQMKKDGMDHKINSLLFLFFIHIIAYSIILFTEAKKETILDATYQAMKHETHATAKRVVELQKEYQNLLGDIATPKKKKPKKMK